MKYMKNYPIESGSQEIGKLAGRALGANLPNNWTETDCSGDTDFGIDYIVSLKQDNNEVTYSFYLQLKGTKSPEFIDNGKYIVHDFKTTTLNLYNNSEPAVMVAVVDLSADPLPKNCPVYYKWLDDDFFEDIKEKLLTNKTIRIQIDKENLITNDLNANDYYERRISLKKVLSEFHSVVKEHSSNAYNDILEISTAIKNKPSIIEVIKVDDDAPWVTLPDKHNSTKLKDISDAIQQGKLSYSLSLLSNLIADESLTDHELSEVFYQYSRIYSLKGNGAKSLEYAEKAYLKNMKSRYKVLYFEFYIRFHEDLKNDDLKKFVNELSSDDIKECLLKAKIYALLDDYNSSFQILDKLPIETTYGCRAIILSIDNNSFENLISLYNEDDFNESTKLLHYIFCSRYYFYKGIGDYKIGENSIIPPTGVESFNLDILSKSLECCKKAWELASKTNYPPNIIGCIDISTVLFFTFNDINYIKVHLSKIFHDYEMYSNEDVFDSYIRILFYSGEYSSVVNAFNKNPENKNILNIPIHIISCFNEGKKSKTLSLLDDNLEALELDGRIKTPGLYILALKCSDELLERSKFESYRERLLKITDGYIFEKCFILIRDKNINVRDDIYRLSFNCDDSSRPLLAEIIINFYNNSLDEDAKIVFELVKMIRLDRDLSSDESIFYAHSLITLERWVELDNLASHFIIKNADRHAWMIIKSDALERQGRLSDSIKVLESGIDENGYNLDSTGSLVNICMRLGIFNKAEDKLNWMLGNNSGLKPVNILRSLIFIYLNNLSNPEKLIEAIRKFGEYIDRNDELDEGQYLYFILTYPFEKELMPESMLSDFRTRLEIYVTKFPDSRVLRRGTIPENGSAENILDAINNLIGHKNEYSSEVKKALTLFRNGRLYIPFVARSRFSPQFIDYIQAWSSRSTEHNDFSIPHSQRNINLKLDDIRINKIVLDEVALLSLYSMGCLELVLASFNNIIIRRHAYYDLVSKSQFVKGNLYHKHASYIKEIILNNLNNIILVGRDSEAFVVEDYRFILSKHKNSILCTDDGALSFYIKQENETVESICVLDIFVLLEDASIIDENFRISKILEFCSLPFTTIQLSYIEIYKCISLVNQKNDNELSLQLRNLFGAVFTESLKSNDAFEILRNICKVCLEHSEYDEENRLVELIRLFMLRYTSFQPLELLSSLFVSIGYAVKCRFEHDLIHYSIPHRNLLKLIENASNCYGCNRNTIYKAIMLYILSHDANVASDLYDTALHSFLPYTEEYDYFAETYAKYAIEIRLQQGFI